MLQVLRVHANNSNTTGHNGQVSAVYGTAAAVVPLQRVQGAAVAAQIADLCNQPIQAANPTTRKAGQDNTELRDVPSPQYVTEWLFNVLGGAASLSTEAPVVHKKVLLQSTSLATLCMLIAANR